MVDRGAFAGARICLSGTKRSGYWLAIWVTHGQNLNGFALSTSEMEIQGYTLLPRKAMSQEEDFISWTQEKHGMFTVRMQFLMLMQVLSMRRRMVLGEQFYVRDHDGKVVVLAWDSITTVKLQQWVEPHATKD
jgi:hypothetical protein